MGILKTIDFDLATTEEVVVNVPGATRFDIEVAGIVNVVNRGGDTVGTITDTSENYYWSGAFKLVASGSAAGFIIAVEDSQR